MATSFSLSPRRSASITSTSLSEMPNALRVAGCLSQTSSQARDRGCGFARPSCDIAVCVTKGGRTFRGRLSGGGSFKLLGPSPWRCVMRTPACRACDTGLFLEGGGPISCPMADRSSRHRRSPITKPPSWTDVARKCATAYPPASGKPSCIAIETEYSRERVLCARSLDRASRPRSIGGANRRCDARMSLSRSRRQK